MRFVVLAIALAACGTDPSPHDVEPCVGWTNPNGSPLDANCERACADHAALIAAPDLGPCMASSVGDSHLGLADQITFQVTGSFEVDGVRGTCAPIGVHSDVLVVFGVCQ